MHLESLYEVWPLILMVVLFVIFGLAMDKLEQKIISSRNKGDV